ncbi:hypothetical protein NZK35_08665 [Stieleria sp. ICT_E10.1]|uniref:hypothetical protein n=1 Tax=Stieleria sedimenti TaxID=2976331 RepID=UPI00217F5DBE|nr:hypothetical protein [Stieleria sedimenti]MCS7466714.1 hypothetical protein [Stieleria sedimenti]
MPTYSYKKHQVTISAAGEIIVKRGDTVSGYCAAIYQASPPSTRAHWSEFGRKDHAGTIRPLLDPNRIKVGETLYHFPSIQKTKREKKVDANQMTVRLNRLKLLREDGISIYSRIEEELLQQKKDVDNFSLGLDMAGVVATAVVTGWGQVAKAFKSSANVVDDVTKAILKRSWGVGFQPQNQGAVQGVAQNLVNSGDNMVPDDSDHTVVALGKILVGSFVDMSSPSFWSKKMAGGDPKEELNRAIEMNQRNRASFLSKIDGAIRQSESLLAQARKND